MSIHWMDRVWKHSQASGSELLLLLAIADNANDAGLAWPGQRYLSEKIRMDVRSVRRLQDKLVEMGEMAVVISIGRTNTNQYWILTGRSDAERREVLEIVAEEQKKQDNLTGFSGIKADKTPAFTQRNADTGGKNADNFAGNADKKDVNADIAMSDKPLTINQPSEPEDNQSQIFLKSTLQSMAFDKATGRFIEKYVVRPEVASSDGGVWTVMVDQPPPEVLDPNANVAVYLQDRFGAQLCRNLAAMICVGDVKVVFLRRESDGGVVRDVSGSVGGSTQHAAGKAAQGGGAHPHAHQRLPAVQGQMARAGAVGRGRR